MGGVWNHWFWNPWWGWGGVWGPGYGYYAPWPGYYYPPTNTVAPYPPPYGPGDSGNGDDNASPNSYAYPDPGANYDSPSMIPANSIEAAPLQDTNSPNASPAPATSPTTSPTPATSPATAPSPSTKPTSPTPQTRPPVQTASEAQAL
jgi:hypothetical protein